MAQLDSRVGVPPGAVVSSSQLTPITAVMVGERLTTLQQRCPPATEPPSESGGGSSNPVRVRGFNVRSTLRASFRTQSAARPARVERCGRAHARAGCTRPLGLVRSAESPGGPRRGGADAMRGPSLSTRSAGLRWRRPSSSRSQSASLCSSGTSRRSSRARGGGLTRPRSPPRPAGCAPPA